MSEWVTDCRAKPIQERTPTGAPYCWSTHVQILLHEQDHHGIQLYPDGVALAYYRYDDECWHWHELSGGPALQPRAWRYL